MRRYNGYLIEGRAALMHPYDPSHYPAGTILEPDRAGSIIELGRVELPSFTMAMSELAEWFGLELCRIAVDECFLSR